MRIGVCTGGGDCPGLNAAIRAIVKYGLQFHNMEIIGIHDSFNGLAERPMRTKKLLKNDVMGILSRGGTILGTYNKGDHFGGNDQQKRIESITSAFTELRLEALIVIGGEGTQSMAQQLIDQGIPIVGIPKTIDNDLPGTEQTIGFSSCIDLVTQSLERLRSTAESHDRVMILEVMGRDSGYIALHGGIAGGANVILLPEIPFDYEAIIEKIKYRKSLQRNFSIIVVSEGARPIGGELSYSKEHSGKTVLGGIGQQVAAKIFSMTQIETRVTVLGHLQRGGSPNTYDRLLATQFGVKAVELISKKKFNQIVTLKGNQISEIPYQDVQRYERKKLSKKDNLILTAEKIGINLGRQP